MKLVSLFLLTLATIFSTDSAFAAPPMNMGITDYKSYLYYADAPFEVIVSTQTDLCQEVSVEGEFTRLPATQRNAREIIQTWIVEFTAFPYFGACRTESPRAVSAKERLKITPKKGQHYFSFVVPEGFSLEFK
jgi:hypothetical protein